MRNLFTIRQVAKCCDISRATILRLEERGILTPAFIDIKTGYRWYDNNNITKILHIKLFLSMGMSYDDILLYYNSNGTSAELLKRIEERLSLAKRTYEEMKLRIENKPHLSFEIINLPQYVCYTKEFTGAAISDRYKALYDVFHEVVEKGYKPLISESLFIINKRTDFLKGEFRNAECNFICCIPLEPDCKDENITVLPACKAFSCLYYGGYEKTAEIYNKFGRKIRELGIKPTGYPRTLCIVAPYTSLEFNEKSYVTRFAIPIEDIADNKKFDM